MCAFLCFNINACVLVQVSALPYLANAFALNVFNLCLFVGPKPSQPSVTVGHS